MNLELIPAEYRLLLDTVGIADWVMHAHDGGLREDTQGHRALFQKIYAQAAEAGCADLVTYDEGQGGYIETEEFAAESPALDLIDEYSQERFWGELAARLAWRDALREVGEAQLQAMNGDKRAQLIADLEQKWTAELERNGLDRLEISGQGAR